MFVFGLFCFKVKVPEIPLLLPFSVIWEKGEGTEGGVFHTPHRAGELTATRYSGCQKLLKAPKVIRGICGRKNPLRCNKKGRDFLDLQAVPRKDMRGRSWMFAFVLFCSWCSFLSTLRNRLHQSNLGASLPNQFLGKHC